MDSEELERFRNQWKAELQKGTSSKPEPEKTATSHKTPASPPAPRVPAPVHIRSLSFASSSGIKDEYGAQSIDLSKAKAPRTALEHFERAVEYENEGSQGKSLEHYRKAFRLDEHVDLLYREKHFPKSSYVPPRDTSKLSATYSVDSLAKSFAGISINGGQPKAEAAPEEALEVVPQSPLAKIPSELLLHIFRLVAVSDVASFARLSLVCKTFAYIVMTEESIWKDVCESEKAFGGLVWNWICTEGGEPLQPEDEEYEETVPPDNEEQVLLYGGSWRVMFRDRPRIHYNGVYISTCNYVRQGHQSATSATWGSPVHIVTYYRFLRFYPDGTCISLLSTDTPSVVVPEYGKNPPSYLDWSSKIQKGRWKMAPDGSLEIETFPESPSLEKYSFCMALTVKTASGSLASSANAGPGGRRNRLVWKAHWSRNKITEDVAEFGQKHDKPYVFSRVLRIEREMGL